MPVHHLVGLLFTLGPVLAPFLGTEPLLAQKVIHIPDEPACAQCTIELEPLVTLGTRSDPVWPGPGSTVAVDSTGHFYVANTYTPGVIALYSPEGEFVRTFGREGEGPGEFAGRIRRLAVASDGTLHVLERQRRTILAPGLSGVVDVHPLGIPVWETIVIEGGRLVANYPLWGRDRTLQPLHLLDADGEVVRSFGGRDMKDAERTRYSSTRDLAPASEGTFWSAWDTRYRIDRWDTAGVLHASIIREAEWYPPWTPIRFVYINPMPHVVSVLPDSGGRLWIGISVTDREWESPAHAARDLESHPDSIDYSAYVDRVVEVIDIDRGRVIARRRFDDSVAIFRGADGTPMASRGEEDELGLVRIHLWRMRIDSLKHSGRKS